MAEPLISVLMGSESDSSIMENCLKVLEELGISYEVVVLSAHRNPKELISYTEKLEERGIKVVIAGAGGAAHLPGVVAAHTELPVIGVPLASSPLHGVDALYSIVQMPAGVPVGCMAVGKAGAVNAAVFAAKILCLYNESFKKRLLDYKKKFRKGK